MNTNMSIAQMLRGQGNKDACQSYEAALQIADSIPAYANHPVVRGWRKEYQSFCSGAEENSDNSDDPNALLQQLFQAFIAVQSSDQMAQLVAQLPTEMLDVLEQIVEGIIAEYPPTDVEMSQHNLDDLRRLRGQ